MQRERDKIEASLRKKGFQIVSGKGRSTDHRYYRLFLDDSPVPVVTTKVSLGSGYKSIGDSLLGQMAAQCKLSKEQFLGLVDCPLTLDEFAVILRQQGVIGNEADPGSR